MLYLRRIAEEFGLERVAELADEVYRGEMQGLVVDIDPVWYWSWKNRYSFQEEPHPGPWIDMFPWLPWSQSGCGKRQSVALDPPDLKWKPMWWKYYERDVRGRKHDLPPVILRICLMPSSSRDERREVDFSNATPLPVIVERRPLARLSANPRSQARPLVGGVSAGNHSAYGTLGGILKDRKSGNRFGLTCGHIRLCDGDDVYQPAPRDGRPEKIGTVLKASTLVPLAPGQVCNPYASSKASQLHEVDVALIKLDTGIASEFSIMNVGTVDGLAKKSSLHPFLAVEMGSRSSKHRTLEVGGLAVTYQFKDSYGVYCFQNLFEVRMPDGIGAYRSAIRSGDSGAWLCCNGPSGMEWAGMVIGEDRSLGYAAFSETTIDWLEARTKSTFECS